MRPPDNQVTSNQPQSGPLQTVSVARAIIATSSPSLEHLGRILSFLATSHACQKLISIPLRLEKDVQQISVTETVAVMFAIGTSLRCCKAKPPVYDVALAYWLRRTARRRMKYTLSHGVTSSRNGCLMRRGRSSGKYSCPCRIHFGTVCSGYLTSPSKKPACHQNCISSRLPSACALTSSISNPLQYLHKSPSSSSKLNPF